MVGGTLGIAVDSVGNALVTGWFKGTVTFGDGTSLTSRGGLDVFVMKVTSAGSVAWAMKFGGPQVDANGRCVWREGASGVGWKE